VKLPKFEYVAPSSPEEVVKVLAAHRGEAKVIAGGQSLLPTMAFRLAQPAMLVDLRKLEGLDKIVIAGSGIRLGARTRWCDVENNARLANAHPLLVEAVKHVAHYQVRNRGTIGGSLAHADPASELPCIAATCEAELRVLGPSGERQIAAADFFQGPLTTALAQDELILDVRLPPWAAGRKWAFSEFARRPGDFALAGVALFYDLDREERACNAHIGVLGACYFPARLTGAERALNGCRVDAETAKAVGAAAVAEADPTDDIHASAEYRKALVGTLLERALVAAANRSA
jgi:carbon-monoxide dehydrogenase medium subunit